MIAQLAVAALLLASGGWTPAPEAPPVIPAKDLAASVHTYDLESSVLALDTTDYRGGKRIISLSSDILFDVDESDLPAAAGAQIKKLLADVPKGAGLAIGGHTDSRTGAIPNKVLSTDRAKAVAALVKKQRPDLELSVKGLADTQPAALGDQEDAENRAKNRRVEMIYEG
ncbi:OmpA family protein [Paeniglutamicibacter antarcticus]|uniref:OmpA-like domain-containing protein n=1 Tax=Paeniglutamicibacter antarcticus TaxID=494023 RepID=A0ABP9TSM6_9MICC